MLTSESVRSDQWVAIVYTAQLYISLQNMNAIMQLEGAFNQLAICFAKYNVS